MIQLQEPRNTARFSLFALGFRPFFLGGAIAAVLLMIFWLIIYTKGFNPGYYQHSIFWHSHEMIFGFALAIIAGFLLTAVRNWTQVQTITGKSLAALCLLWVIPRLLPLLGENTNPWLLAILDLSFMPIFIICISLPILKSKNYRNLIFIPILIAFFSGNLLFHLQMLQITQTTADQGILLGLLLTIIIISLIAGRVIPFFTERGIGIPETKCTRNPLIEKSIIILSLPWLLFSLSSLSTFSASLSLTLGAIHIIRWCGWFKLGVFRVPLLWILHISYLFIILGFIGLGLSQLGIFNRSIAYHAFAAGGIGGLTLGMAARVSLGHTGRLLKVGHLMTASFTLATLAAIIRISISINPLPYTATLHLSGTLWILAWILFLIQYTPVLIKPRVDGLAG